MTQVQTGTMSLIDLAGSERASSTNNRGARLTEGANINKSLLALANCINALSRPSRGPAPRVKYRDSKLTHLLKSSLEGNCALVMIACVNPAHTTFEESHNTLKYANRAKDIKVNPQSHMAIFSPTPAAKRAAALLLEKKKRQEQMAREAKERMEFQREEAERRKAFLKREAQLEQQFAGPRQAWNSTAQESENAGMCIYEDPANGNGAKTDIERTTEIIMMSDREEDEEEEEVQALGINTSSGEGLLASSPSSKLESHEGKVAKLRPRRAPPALPAVQEITSSTVSVASELQKLQAKVQMLEEQNRKLRLQNAALQAKQGDKSVRKGLLRTSTNAMSRQLRALKRKHGNLGPKAKKGKDILNAKFDRPRPPLRNVSNASEKGGENNMPAKHGRRVRRKSLIPRPTWER